MDNIASYICSIALDGKVSEALPRKMGMNIIMGLAVTDISCRLELILFVAVPEVVSRAEVKSLVATYIFRKFKINFILCRRIKGNPACDVFAYIVGFNAVVFADAYGSTRS